MILQIDMGNTRIKWRLREQLRTLVDGVGLIGDGWCWLASISKHEIKAVHVSSVLGEASNKQLIERCCAAGLPSPVFAQTQSAFSFTQEYVLLNGYDNPERLGVDRWLALLAARKHTATACVVVDAGSAMTVDVIDRGGRHLGGYLAPGLNMMRQSLQGCAADLVGSLSQVTAASVSGLGASTQGCIDAALLNMGHGLICAAKERACTDVLYLTGGDARVWFSVFNEAILMSDMVLDGLGYYFE